MLSSLRAALVILAASVVAVDATSSLTVKTSVPNVEVDGLQNLKVIVTVFNTGNETLKLLNDPRGVLSSFPEHSFTITHAAGSHPRFSGAKVKFSPTYVVGIDDPSDFTILAPGTSINVTHDLSAAYNFTRSGAGDYSIEPLNLFTYVDGDGALKDLYATVEGVAEVKLSGILAVSRRGDDPVPLPPTPKIPKFQDCTVAQEVALTALALEAEEWVASAIEHLEFNSFSLRYHMWFGLKQSDRWKSVLKHYAEIFASSIPQYNYICTVRHPTWAAWSFHDQVGFVFISGGFWSLLPVGSNSQPGALIYAASHFDLLNGILKGATDWARSEEACRRLSLDNPDQAVENSNSFQFFAENFPPA